MSIYLKDLLNLSESEINNSKIELNMTAGRGAEWFVDRWLRNDEKTRESGVTDCSFWGWFGKRRNFHVGQIVFSFIKIEYDEWLLVSVAKIVDIPENSRAKVEILEKYKGWFGRLLIKYKKGNTYSQYVFNLRNLLPNIIVKEILPCMYSGEKFEGYDKVNLPYTKLKDIFNGKLMPTYYEALQKITGIYCLTDTNNGKLYIGSATGVDGVAQRWGNYLNNKHGGNKKLIRLYQEQGDEYFEKYFTFTIIEYFGLSYDTAKIIDREQYWKKCFDTLHNGYNDN